MAGAIGSDALDFGGAKELYADDKYYQERTAASLYKFIRKSREGEVEFDGKKFNVSVQFQYNEAFGAKLDNEALPQADYPAEIFCSWSPKLHYATMEMSWFAATRGHKDGRVGGRYMDDYVKGTLISMNAGLSHALYANGRGQIAVVATATPGQLSFTVVTSTRIRPGMRFDWYDPTLTTKRGTIQIDQKGVDRISKTPFIKASYGTGAVPTGAGANDILVLQGSLDAGEPSDGRFLAGFKRITDNSVAYGSISPADYAWWRATNQNASGGNPTETLFQQQFDLMYDITGDYPNRMVIRSNQKRLYLSQFLAQRRFTSNSYDTGADSLSFSPLKMGEDEKQEKPSECRMLEDRDADVDEILFWNDEMLCLAHDLYDGPTIADEDGSDFRKRVGFDADQGFYRAWMNTVCYKRAAVGKIFNLATGTAFI
jgi:hypothetical protein